MSLGAYRRRIERLEARKNAERFGQNLVFGRFALWTDKLPEGTAIPPGARVVRDFYAFESSPNEEGFTGGYYQERITTIPDDNGHTIYKAPAASGAGEPGDAPGG